MITNKSFYWIIINKFWSDETKKFPVNVAWYIGFLRGSIFSIFDSFWFFHQKVFLEYFGMDTLVYSYTTYRICLCRSLCNACGVIPVYLTFYAIMYSVTTASALSLIYVFIFTGSNGYPRSVLLMYYILKMIQFLQDWV